MITLLGSSKLWRLKVSRVGSFEIFFSCFYLYLFFIFLLGREAWVISNLSGSCCLMIINQFRQSFCVLKINMTLIFIIIIPYLSFTQGGCHLYRIQDYDNNNNVKVVS